ncbi:hypothetical protein N665_0991s0002 [Sinapis alba]|nr:hypothetical protein N665_0991s0002 [Sinapis alba]
MTIETSAIGGDPSEAQATSPKRVEVTPKGTWVQAVQSKQVLSQHAFQITEVNGSKMVVVPDKVLEDKPLWDDLLVGRFLDSAPHVAKIHVIVNKIWPLGDKKSQIDAFAVNEKLVKFRIRDATTRSRVLRRGMWNIAGVPMVVSKWAPVIEQKEEDITVIPMWVKLKNVPHSLFSWSGLGFIASAVGFPKRLHPETELCNNFEEAKVFVEAEISKGFPKMHKFKLQEEEITVDFVYPWLPPKCSACGKWGHLVGKCPSKEKKILQRNSEGEKTSDEGAQTQDEGMTEATQKSKSVVSHEDKMHSAQEIAKNREREVGEKSMVLNEDSDNVTQGWETVSPNKAGRQSEAKASDTFTTTPSRFSVLEDDEKDLGQSQEENAELAKQPDQKDKDEHDLEEGEVEETERRDEKNDKPEILLQEEQGIRASLYRASKSVRVTQDAKLASGVTGKKKTLKKR